MPEKTTKTKKAPLLRVAKRSELTGKQTFILRICSVLLAIIAGGIFILCLGKNPVSVYATMIKGSFISKNCRNRERRSR